MKLGRGLKWAKIKKMLDDAVQPLTKSKIFKGIFASLFLLTSLAIAISLITTGNFDIREKAFDPASKNIVVILTDDLDVESYNTLLQNGKLPNISTLLSNGGLKFNNSFVTDSICCPSRATFLTGRYAHNTGVRNVAGSEGGIGAWSGYMNGYNLNNNIAKWLNGNNTSSDYKTGMIGKFMAYSGPINPGWNYWRNIIGYDSRPKMYKVITGPQTSTIRPDKYQLKYINDEANSFLDQYAAPNKRFFLYLTPTTPHITLPVWTQTVQNFGSGVVSNPSNVNDNDPIVGWSSFINPNGVLQNHVIRGNYSRPAGQRYSFYSRTFQNGVWSLWARTGGEDLVPNTGTGPIVAWSTYIADNGDIVQHLLRGAGPNPKFWARKFEVANNRWIPWYDAGDVASIGIGYQSANLPVVGWETGNIGGTNRMQMLVVGDEVHGYYAYTRSGIGGPGGGAQWTRWREHLPGWYNSTTDGEIADVGIQLAADGTIAIQLFRKNNSPGNLYDAYTQNIANYFEGEVLAASSTNSNEFTPINIDPSFSVEGDMYKVTSSSGQPHSYLTGRVYADGNWDNLKTAQTFPKSLYPGNNYPAGTLRSDGVDGYTPISSTYDLPGIRDQKPSFNNAGCNNSKPHYVCDYWNDMFEDINGGNNQQIDYQRRLHLDRLESMMSVDVLVGQVMQKLVQKGVDQDTVIILTSDNGYFNGDYRLSNKVLPYEESLRVPLIIKAPDVAYTGNGRDEMVVNIDLAPTIMDYAGFDWQSSIYNINGRSLRPLIKNESIQWRKWFLTENRYPRDFPGISLWWAWGQPDFTGVRELYGNQNFMLTQYTDDPTPPNQDDFKDFYNLSIDPFEVNNLYNNITGTIAGGQSMITKYNNLTTTMNQLKNCVASGCRDVDGGVPDSTQSSSGSGETVQESEPTFLKGK